LQPLLLVRRLLVGYLCFDFLEGSYFSSSESQSMPLIALIFAASIAIFLARFPVMGSADLFIANCLS
jgi:hypothetical protein